MATNPVDYILAGTSPTSEHYRGERHSKALKYVVACRRNFKYKPAERPRQINISEVVHNCVVPLLNRERHNIIYLRHIRGQEIYDKYSITELQQLCHIGNVSLRGMPEVYPGPIAHPWVQESFRRLHTRLVEALEKSETAITLHDFPKLPRNVRKKIYSFYFGTEDITTFVEPPPITKTSRLVRMETLPFFFNREFRLDTKTQNPTIHANLLPPTGLGERLASTGIPQDASRRFRKAPPSYSNQVRRLVVWRWLNPTWRADRGHWRINLDAVEKYERVKWVPEAGHAEGYEDDAKARRKMEKGIADATSRLQKFIDDITERDGLLQGADVKGISRALENGKN